MSDRYMALAAFLSCVVAIVILAITGAIIIASVELKDDKALAQLIAALGFISAAISGLVAVAGTFRPRAAMTEEKSG